MPGKKDRYIPALNVNWLTPVYDLVVRSLMPEASFKAKLVQLARLQPNEKAIDLGCGTGTLTLMLQASQPQATITGLDGDDAILEIARKKAQKSNFPGIDWKKAEVTNLAFQAGTFDVALSSMMIHHLTKENKRKMFAEVIRVLKPGGRFIIADFGEPHDFLMRVVTMVMIHFEHTVENFKGQFTEMLISAGFDQVNEIIRYRTFFGPITIFECCLAKREEIHE